ncbi:aldehyde dehydrogenase family 3 member B1 [Boleophthalmus pectinirostris]|uniref:aldehyde dehydrogenase family 3 member B1 n=1 Tax=Boleophthalmus pectinirostris TaxID=150288 RepID=UPI00242B415F|nr:aldehyde dehydrogenase family 3 member B1 [Boleophthalmus pectinirostris]XP_055008762.1 aldehyde dehydrogenase family 3 member B1 [Boleophthalmus pectinirostris]
MESHSAMLQRLRTSFQSGVTVPEKFRRAQLNQLLSLLQENEQRILEALHKDLAKPKFEAVLSEMDIVINEVHFALSNLRSWMQDEHVTKTLATKVDECYVRREPLGVVLIIGPWNYPIHLLLLPLVGAIAAGNCVVIKPSEVSSAVEAVIAELVPKYLSQDCFAVVCGGAEDTQALLKNKFDHILYTGSQSVARCILQAAAPHLTPVTLELGGKCPCFIHHRVDPLAAARRLAWAKYFNVGQSCVAPDYVLCTEETRDALVTALKQVLFEFYGEEPQKCPDMARIISAKHWTRLMGLLGKSKGKVVLGGESDEADKYIAPTVLVDVSEDDALMQEEIFGPLLPFITVSSVDEAIAFMNRQEKPLALYVFSDDSSIVNTVLEKTSSGAFCSNDGIIHMTLPGLPFGGVGASGFGSYHGRWGFETFSHKRAVVLRGWALERINGLRYPPFTDNKLSWLRWTASPKSCSIM